MKKSIYLVNAECRIDLMKNSTDEIREQVTKDFEKFTQGTSERYRNADKLLYLDNIRNRLHIEDFETFVKEYVNDKLIFQLDVSDLINDTFEVDFGYEFAESVFNDRKCNFYKGGRNPIFYDNLVEIIKTVMEF